MSKRRWSALLAVLGTVAAAMLVASGGPAAADPPAKIAPDLRGQLRSGSATFWVMLAGDADLSAARRSSGKDRAAQVYRAKTQHADRTQRGLRDLLRSRKASFTTFWIADAIRVTGDAALADAVARRPEVSAVLADRTVRLPAPSPGTERAQVQDVEWNVERIGATRVWSDFADRGEGIVVANVDTGVQWDHPALAAAYRGRAADGTVSHDYNWFDPTGLCAGGAPCDTSGHGTHTMGTMVGGTADDHIGVAPGARWIAAKGCETNSCSAASLLAAGQWIVAPTDRNGGNPRPDLAPDVVNNSWGGYGFDPWYRQVVEAWVAAGIFPAFSNGNAGPGCTTAGSPGNYTAAYASGATGRDDRIADFSSRGSGENGELKPNLAAPGVDVRSSIPGGYASYSGTSMASPHTAATVALLWAAVPGLRRDIAATREVLDTTAIDTDDRSCGGTAQDNNVYGEGRLDAYAAVSLARQPSGSLVGTVRGGDGPLAGASVALTGPIQRTATTGADGGYRFGLLPAGDYHVVFRAYGYRDQAADVHVDANEERRLDVTLEAAPSATVSGTVTGAGAAVSGVTVALDGTPATTRTDADGHYRLTAPIGEYRLTVTPIGGCFAGTARGVDLTADRTVDVILESRVDRAGTTCRPVTDAYRAGDHRLDLTGDDVAVEVALPFEVPLYGTPSSRIWVSSNGLITFGGADASFYNTPIPSAAVPNWAVYPFWDDLFVEGTADGQPGVYTATVGDAFVVEWRDVAFYADRPHHISFSATLARDGTVTFGYRAPSGPLGDGRSATIGVENADGTDALAYSVDTPGVVADGTGVQFRPAAT